MYQHSTNIRATFTCMSYGANTSTVPVESSVLICLLASFSCPQPSEVLMSVTLYATFLVFFLSIHIGRSEVGTAGN